jgi:two-component sensor histidine kinase
MGASVEHKANTPPLAELLLDEFTHRINNELATLIALVRREESMTRDPATTCALKRVHERLVSVGRIQHVLQGPRSDKDLDAGDYLRQLCESRRTALEHVDVLFVGCKVNLDPARCRRLGMIVSELVENARKHAFGGAHSSISGSISVELGLLDGKIQCRVADNGHGYSGAHHGRGLTIVRALAESLNGRITLESVIGGTAWRLTIPH